ncbi:MAG: peptidyl-prolyl cis-trans isomerase D, partial [Paracoccaceae bacterium]
GLLVVSLTGFGVQNVGSGGSQAIGSVGDEKITVNEYAAALNNQLRAISQQIGQTITLEQGLSFGLGDQVIAQVFNTATLNGENNRIGLSIGDEFVKENLLATQAFQSLTGQFDKVAYDFALERANLTASEYDETIRSDTARTLLQASIVSGVRANDSYAKALLGFVAEVRDFSWATIDASLLAEPVREPNPAEIDAQYKANPAAYTAAEARKLTFVLLSPEMLISSIQPDDAALLQLYEDETGRFNQPDRRIVDRLVFSTNAEAQAALDSITGGAKIFADIVATRGLTLEDVDLGEVQTGDLSAAAANAVFFVTEPGVVGPVETSLGPALFRVNAILSAQHTTFDQARDELHREYVADQARRQIDQDITTIDDLLAGGAKLEEVAGETAMVLATTEYRIGDQTGIAANEEFRQAAEAVNSGDFPEVLTLADGGIFALRLDAIIPPALIPLNDVKDQVVADWKASETRRQVLSLASTFKTRLEAGETFTDLGLLAKTELNIRRDALTQAAPAGLVRDIFAQDQNGVAVTEDRDRVALSQLITITAFDENSTGNQALMTSVGQQFSTQIGNDILDAFTAAMQDEAGVSINQPLINAVHSQTNGQRSSHGS